MQLVLVVFNLFDPYAGDSYLVAGTDGVGTKLKLAFETGIHETIGIDLVTIDFDIWSCFCCLQLAFYST